MQTTAYGDILDKERPAHRNDLFFYRHPSMPVSQRAKLFAPYDALTGFSGEVRAKEIPYEPRRILDADEKWELNRRLSLLREYTFNRATIEACHPLVLVEHFVPCADPHHDGYGTLGQYVTFKGLARRVDPTERVLWVADRAIAFRDLYDISDPEGRLFRNVRRL